MPHRLDMVQRRVVRGGKGRQVEDGSSPDLVDGSLPELEGTFLNSLAGWQGPPSQRPGEGKTARPGVKHMARPRGTARPFKGLDLATQATST